MIRKILRGNFPVRETAFLYVLCSVGGRRGGGGVGRWDFSPLWAIRGMCGPEGYVFF